MTLTQIILAALLPALALLGFIHYTDRAQSEPTRYIVLGFLFGIISCLPAAFLESLYSNVFTGTPALQALSPALFEEGSKGLFILWLIHIARRYFDEHLDGIVYATSVGVGFEFAENILYFINDPSCITVRTLMPGHFAFAIIMGYFIAQAYFSKGIRRFNNSLKAFFMPALAHWIWDFLCFANEQSGGALMLVFFAFLIALFFIVKRAVKKQQQRDAEMRARQQAEQAQGNWQNFIADMMRQAEERRRQEVQQNNDWNHLKF